jgi:hypothetical protein
MEKDEIRLRCIEAAARQTVSHVDALARAELFYEYVLKSPNQLTDNKPAVQATQAPGPSPREPRKSADNVKHLT